MEAKKSPKADLESKKTLFLEIGLTFALAVALLAFNWKSYEKKEATFAQGVVMEIPEETIIQTQENTPPPPPPEPEVQMSEDIQIVEDDVEIEHELKPINADDLTKPDLPVVKVEIQDEEEVVEEEEEPEERQYILNVTAEEQQAEATARIKELSEKLGISAIEITKSLFTLS